MTLPCPAPCRSLDQDVHHFYGGLGMSSLKAYATMYYVKNMKKAVTFYKDIVGLTPRFEDDSWTEFDLNGTSLALHIAGDQPVTNGGGVLILEVADIEKTVGAMKENRVTFVKEITDIGCGLCADFKDLDGHVIGLYQHKEGGQVTECK